MTKMTPSATRCALCQKVAPLRLSHIIPKFVVRFALRTSPGLLRTVQNPNRRVQDGFKTELLCEVCEQLFSEWEASFARAVFLPVHTKNPTEFRTFAYGPWCMKFAASAVWRTAQFLRRQGAKLKNLSDAQRRSLEEAELTWQRFIFNEIPNPGSHELHLYPLEALASLPDIDSNPSSYLNRYMLRGQAIDIVARPGLSFVYVKMLKLVLLGFIEPPNANEWRGGKLRVRNGEVGSRKRRWPHDFFLYINSQAQAWHAAMDSLSDTQKRKIDELVKDAGEDLYATESYRAWAADFAMFGENAFSDETEE
jgi:hypothetical protein